MKMTRLLVAVVLIAGTYSMQAKPNGNAPKKGSNAGTSTTKPTPTVKAGTIW